MATTATTPSVNNQALTQADFLQLLVTQMTSQDPLNPQSDTAFAAQLAQFTALQTAQTTQQNIAVLQASQLIGSTVAASPDGGATVVTGVVAGVQINSGVPSLIVNGNAYPLNQILDIAPTAANPASQSSSQSSQNANAASTTSTPSNPAPVMDTAPTAPSP